MSLPPNATLAPTPFTVSIPESSLDSLKTLLRLSPLAPATYEGTLRKYGVTSKWMAETKKYWEGTFDWRKHEEEINTFPHYTVPVQHSDGSTYSIHFIGIFSADPAAVPLLLLHGWPGSFIEFLSLITILRKSTSPSFHIIVPSLPGYAFSQGPPVHKEFQLKDVAYLMNQLMVGLGLAGYVIQGGDLGSMLARLMQAEFDECKAVHLNMAIIGASSRNTDNLSAADAGLLAHSMIFATSGMAYASAHATKPSTIAHAVASSPVALLAWVGEKLMDWTDADPSVEMVLRLVTLWWLTETFPRSIYPYREFMPPTANEENMHPPNKKPHGFSNFLKDLMPAPESWVRAEFGQDVFFKQHDNGGHFAAWEVPEALAEDVVEFVKSLEK